MMIERSASELDIAVAFVWFRIAHEDAAICTSAEVYEFFDQEGISKPNRTRLKQRMISDRRLLSSSAGFRVRLAAATLFESELPLPMAKDQPTSAETASHSESGLIRSLTVHAQAIHNSQSRSFVLEAIDCAKARCYRAAVVMSWCGAVAILQDYVFTHALDAFNADAVANGLLKKEAKSATDIRGISKESQFIEALGRISILDDSMKRALKRCLDRRNDCGHPSDLRLAEAAVADHLDALILNVFDRFSPMAATAA
jgi:hypothetical protein